MFKIDKIIRSRRRTLGLEVARDASLIVRAPERISLGYIQKIVFKKRFWIQKKQHLAREKYKKLIPKEFVDGEEFLYLGDSHRLLIVDDGDAPLLFNKEFHLVRKYLPFAKGLFIDWYKTEAYRKIKGRVGWYSTLLGFKYNKFGISNARKRWGSCSGKPSHQYIGVEGKGNLSFSWRLIMAPSYVIDYVVVHELVHLTEKNHSKRFWDRLKIIQPDYKERKKWLKDNAHLLIFEG